VSDQRTFIGRSFMGRRTFNVYKAFVKRFIFPVEFQSTSLILYRPVLNLNKRKKKVWLLMN